MPITAKLKIIKIRYEDIPREPHQPPPLRSTLTDRVAVRMGGPTYLLAPSQAEGFRARHGLEEDLEPDGLDTTQAL